MIEDSADDVQNVNFSLVVVVVQRKTARQSPLKQCSSS